MKLAPAPNASLRQKLLVAGIPESEQTLDALMTRMPDLDSPLLQGLSADMMAELLLYLISKGVVTLPKASDKALLDLPWGSHVCQFYDSKQDQLDMLVPYFKQGLERNEACAWLVGDLTVEEARDALAAAVPDLARLHGQRADADRALQRVLHRPQRHGEGAGAVELPVRRDGIDGQGGRL